MQPSIEHLITLSANVDSPTESNGNMGSCSEDFGDNESTSMDNLGSSQEDDAFEVDTDFTYLNIDDEELQKQKDGFRKFELMRKQSQDFSQGNSPSRLSLNTCAINESPLEAIEDEDIKSKEENMKIDTIKIPDTSNIEKQTKNSCLESYSRDSTYPVFSADEKDSKENLFTCNQNQLPTFSLHGSSQEALKSLRQAPNQVYNIKTEERRKAETESLCGLKVQYRFGGQETSSDDDADVVIEEESSDYNIPNTQTNVCQFLSLSTQSPLKTTKPQIEMINTPSPFSSPANKHKFKENYQSTLSRIKSTIQRGFKIMVILRGLPGSGKSYLARDIVRSTVGGDFSQYIFSTDDFFSKNGRGIYKFDPTKLPEAHTYNQERVLKALREGRSPIIIDNTNTQCWEMKFYAAMAVQYGYFIEVLEPETPWASNLNQLEKRNVHSVSKETLQRMLDRYERNITGAKLLRIFNFSYDPYNMPPQSCSSLPSPSKSKRAPPIDSNKTKTSNKISKPVENLKDYVPSGFANARVVDAIPNPLNENLTALQLAMKTFGGDDDDDELSPKENDQDLIEDKWEDDGISWEDEMLSVEIKKKNSKAFKETLNEDSTCMDDKVLNVNTEADKATYLNLGAIGSERKNVKSLVDYDSDDSDQNENVLSQCWDFTLMLDGRQIHSVGPLSESENADQEKEDENSSEISSNSAISENPMVVDSSSISENPVKSDDSEKSKSPSAELKEAQNILDDKDSPDSGPKSFNTESFEHIDSNSEDLSLDIHEAIDTRGIVESSMNCLISSEEVEKDSETSNTDPQAKVSFGSIMKFIKKSFLGANNDDSKATKVEEVVKYDQQNPKSPETVMDTLTEKLHSPIKEQNSTIKLNYEVGVNISELTMNDTLSKKLSNISQESNNGNTNLACEPQGTFESTRFFQEEFTTLGVDVITNRNETFEHYCSLKKNSSENQSFISAFEAEKVNLIQETSSLKSINSLNDLNFVSPLSKESENKLDVSMIRPAKIKLTGPLARAVLSLDENERLILEEKKLMKSETNNFEKKHVKTKKFDDKSIQYFETIDNINSITWKETPFPTCEIQMSVKAEEPKNVVTSEASTNTNFYDFNVSYVGGTSESEYKLLNTVSRSINEGLILSNLETPPPQKLKLDKSSMTNEVDILLELPSMSGEIEDTEKDVIQGLFDMFPHISRDYVVDVYKNICKSDSHWAIDVLLDGTPSEEILNAKPLKFPIIEDSYLHSSAFRNKRAEKIKQSGNSDFNESDSNSQARKKEKNQVSEDSLALKRHLEDKVMINMSSYHPHILRVKKWKNREPDVPTEEIIEAQARNKDVIQFLNDLNPVEVAPAESLINSEQHLPEEKEESDGEDSSETEETIELSLGWEFIKNLEKEFGDPNFQFPDGLFPVIQVKKSLAEQIHALWMESMQQQIETQQEYLDSMIAKGIFKIYLKIITTLKNGVKNIYKYKYKIKYK